MTDYFKNSTTSCVSTIKPMTKETLDKAIKELKLAVAEREKKEEEDFNAKVIHLPFSLLFPKGQAIKNYYGGV